MGQKTEPLSDTLIEWLEAQRSWVRDHYKSELRYLYETIEGKLELLEAILHGKWADEDWKLEALGVTMGDLLVQKMNMKWVITEDDFGKTLAVELEGKDPIKSVFAHPLGMIQKRLERGEEVDVRELFKQLCEIVKVRCSEIPH